MKKKDNILRSLKRRQVMPVGKFWSECAIGAISYLCALVVMMIVLSSVLDVDTERLTQIVNYAACVLAVLWCIPIARNSRRRLRDAGYSAKAYLWLLLPVVGWLVFLVLLCKKGKLRTPEEANHTIYSWDG